MTTRRPPTTNPWRSTKKKGVMASSSGEKDVPKHTLSCVGCFNTLWFCYSPVHQMQQYYRMGTLDNCGSKWSALIDCLSLKTKSRAELQEVLEAREKAKSHIWTFRTPEEASRNWKELYDVLPFDERE